MAATGTGVMVTGTSIPSQAKEAWMSAQGNLSHECAAKVPNRHFR